MPLITREGKGSKLSISEMDGNLLYLENLATTETISVTYEQLTSLMESQSLVPGRRYLIADYQNTDGNEKNPTEPIVVTATTNDALSPIAYSTVNTYDILYYDVTMGRQGLITRRIDTLNDRGVEIINDLTTGGTTEALSAEQGKVLYLSKLASSGSSYLYVSGTGTPEENAAELQAAYDAAKLMLPTADNVITVVVAPGSYDFGATAFVVDTPYINIVSLTGNPDVIISSTEANSNYNYNYGIKVTADNVLVKGIDCKTNAFYIESNLDKLICEYCIGGDRSFGRTASGTFNNCIGGNYSFGDTASGTFNNCIGENYSFGCGFDGTAPGTFNRCIGGEQSFGSGFAGAASGTFNNCIGAEGSFGGNLGGTISATARLYYTRITSGTFVTPVAGGRLILCIDGDNNIVTI